MKFWITSANGCHQWIKARDDAELLTSIRRAYHTCKGSGRMVGGLALGDYAWAHENMLNKVLEGSLPRNDRLAALLQDSVAYLERYKGFFLTADAVNEATQAEIAKVESFMEQPEEVFAVLDFSDEAGQQDQPASTTLEFTPVDDAPARADVPEAVAEAVSAAAGPEDEDSGLSTLDWNSVAEPSVSTNTAAGAPDTLDFSANNEPESVAAAERAAASEPVISRIDEREEQRLVWEMFCEELPEQLQNIDQLMQSLTAHPEDRETLQGLERELHTVKGGARMAQLSDMGDIAHQAEDLLSQLGRNRNRDVAPELEQIQVYLDQISELAEQQVLSAAAPPVVEAEPADESGQEAGPVLSFLAEGGGDSTYGSYLERLLQEQAADLPDIALLGGQENSAETENRSSEEGGQLLGQEQVRLAATYLDQLVESANSLNIQQNTLSERLQSMSEDVSEFGRTASRLKQLLRSLELETEAQIHAGYRQSAAAQGKGSDFDPLEMDEYSGNPAPVAGLGRKPERPSEYRGRSQPAAA
ncbi:MAG: Hpt domain-containing protein [Thiolinea sp.]